MFTRFTLIIHFLIDIIRQYRLRRIDQDCTRREVRQNLDGIDSQTPMTATAFPLVRPSFRCVSWSDTARDATTGPPSGIELFVAESATSSRSALFSDRLATRFPREEKFLCGVAARWHAKPRARTPFQQARTVCCPRWCRGVLLSCLSLRQRFAPREGNRLVTKRYSLVYICGNIDMPSWSTDSFSENGNEHWKLHKNICNRLVKIFSVTIIFQCYFFSDVIFSVLRNNTK